MNLALYLKERKQLVEAALSKSLSDESIPQALRKSMEYSLAAGGKRLRPVLVMAGAEAVGGDAQKVMPIACAIEMIHTFSLIHDDLPAMDDDDLRRGKPTNHKVFGEATAVLAGDALMAEAFSVLASAKDSDPKLLIEVIRDVADATGSRGMTGGQQIDMESAGAKLTEADLTRLHGMKTGRLIGVSAVSGAKYCGAAKAQIDALKRYGECVGLAFQIADDILDIEGNQEEIGKDVGSDVENDKATYPAIIGLDQSKRKAAALADQAVTALSVFDGRADPLREIAKYTIERKR